MTGIDVLVAAGILATGVGTGVWMSRSTFQSARLASLLANRATKRAARDTRISQRLTEAASAAQKAATLSTESMSRLEALDRTVFELAQAIRDLSMSRVSPRLSPSMLDDVSINLPPKPTISGPPQRATWGTRTQDEDSSPTKKGAQAGSGQAT